MIKFKTYNQFINEKYDWNNQFNKSSKENNYVGTFGHSFNKIEDVSDMNEAKKILKKRGIGYTEIIEGYSGMAHFRCKPNWTNYQVGVEPKTDKAYSASMTIAAYDPKSKKLYTEPTDTMKDYKKDPQLAETVGTVNAPVYDEDPEEFPEIAVEKEDIRKHKHAKEIGKLLKEIYKTALDCDCDGHKIKEALRPKYKDGKVKMNITDEGKFMFDSFGKYPDVVVDLKNMKKGNHTTETIIEEVKKHLKTITERMAGMPSMSQISSFAE